MPVHGLVIKQTWSWTNIFDTNTGGIYGSSIPVYICGSVNWLQLELVCSTQKYNGAGQVSCHARVVEYFKWSVGFQAGTKTNLENLISHSSFHSLHTLLCCVSLLNTQAIEYTLTHACHDGFMFSIISTCSFLWVLESSGVYFMWKFNNISGYFLWWISCADELL